MTAVCPAALIGARSRRTTLTKQDAIRAVHEAVLTDDEREFGLRVIESMVWPPPLVRAPSREPEWSMRAEWAMDAEPAA